MIPSTRCSTNINDALQIFDATFCKLCTKTLKMSREITGLPDWFLNGNSILK